MCDTSLTLWLLAVPWEITLQKLALLVTKVATEYDAGSGVKLQLWSGGGNEDKRVALALLEEHCNSCGNTGEPYASYDLPEVFLSVYFSM